MNLERTIIGELMHLSKEERIDALIELEKIEFEQYGSLLKTITYLSLQGKEVDTISVYQSNQEIEAIEISKIYAEVDSSAFISQHIYLLKSKQYKKQIIKVLKKGIDNITSGDFGADIEEAKNGLIIDLSSFAIEDRAEFDNLAEYKKQISEQLNSDRTIEGFSWGIADLDRWTSGIVIPRVYVVGGLKKSGKTRFLIQTLKHLHDAEVPTVFLSLEMPAYEVTKLLYASITGFNDMKFRAGSYMKPEEKHQYDKAQIDEKILGVECRSGLTLEQILSRIRRYAKMGFKVIAIDYIQRIVHDRNRQAQELEDISIRIADAARQYNVSTILISQLNAAGEREIPNMGHLKGSGGIGESADTILLLDNLYRRTKQESDRNQMHVYIEQRHGDSGMLKLQCDLGACQFRNIIVEDIDEVFGIPTN